MSIIEYDMADELGNLNPDPGNISSDFVILPDGEAAPGRPEMRDDLTSQLIEEAEAQGTSLNDYPDLTNLLYRLEIYNSIPKDVIDLLSCILDWVREIDDSIRVTI
jgi:type III secretion system FlhB-like substrate exporter